LREKSDNISLGARGTPDAAQMAIDLRAAVLEQHRKDWEVARQLLRAVAEEAEKATGFEKAKFAKIGAETLRIIQEGEHRAWGLDLLILDFEAMTDEQLEAIAAGRRPRCSR
jgi:hypothetical protein